MSYYHAWRWYEDSRDDRRWSHLALILNRLNTAKFAHQLSFAEAFKYIQLLFMTSFVLSLKKTNYTAIKSIDKIQTCFLIKTSLDNNIAVIIVPSLASPYWYNMSPWSLGWLHQLVHSWTCLRWRDEAAITSFLQFLHHPLFYLRVVTQPQNFITQIKCNEAVQ